MYSAARGRNRRAATSIERSEMWDCARREEFRGFAPQRVEDARKCG